ncbi:cpdR [Symbiodinium necroappetens]|uniref:CpdR protein n=1 Tax=Symbiodinium necroappetens TaxID=1628268 RepID=A0A812NA86_9DINO|nr:cpdR [Symbiodinium necroappetens]
MARILLAEDDTSMRRFLARSLDRAGHEVVSVGDGMTALTRLREQSFDLLLADVVMPGLDGVELARRGTQVSPGLKVMFITGFAAVALRARDRQHPGARVLSKPFHLRELVQEVEAMLAA